MSSRVTEVASVPGLLSFGRPRVPHARGIDHAAHIGALARVEHGTRAVHVVAVDLPGILRPQAIVGRHVEDHGAAPDDGGEGVGIEDVAAENLHAAAAERLQAACGAREDPDAVAVGDEQPRHVGSHEAGGPGDQHIHDATSRPRLRLFRRLVALSCYHVQTSPSVVPKGVSMAEKRIGILTGGGDVPGLNSVIKSGGVSGLRARIHRGRIASRVGRIDPCRPSGPREPRAICASAQPAEYPHHRSHRRHLPAHVAHKPVPNDQAAARARRPGLSHRDLLDRRPHVRCHARRPAEHRGPRPGFT